MEQISSLLCSLSLCGLLLAGIFLLLPFQPVSEASQPLSVSKEQPLLQFTPEQLDQIMISSPDGEFRFINHGDRFLLEEMENIPLAKNSLDALLLLFENFPVGLSAELPETAPDRTITITPVSGKSLRLELYPDKNNVIVSNGTEAQKIPSEQLSPLFQPAEQYVPKIILQTEPSSEGTLTISGSCHELPLSISYYYIDKKKDECYAGLAEPFSEEIPDDQINEILSSLSDFQADSVAKLFPDAQDLEEYGLSSPFLQLHGDFQGESFTLRFSRPSTDGEIFLLKDELPVIYSLRESDIPWLSLCPESLMEEEIFSVDYDDCTTMLFSTVEKTARFTKWDGVVLYGGQQIEEENFAEFFDLSTELIPCGIALREQTEDIPLLSLKFSYTNPEQAADSLIFYSYDEDRLRVSVNGNSRYLCEKEKLQKILRKQEQLLP